MSSPTVRIVAFQIRAMVELFDENEMREGGSWIAI